jgi:hypothetical protein
LEKTTAYIIAKTLVVAVLRDRGYRNDTEFIKEGVGETNVVAYSRDEWLFAIEVDTYRINDVISH